MNSRRTTILLLPVAALLIAGCGGGGSEESSEATAEKTATTTVLSKAELIEQGDAICAEVNAAVGSDASNSSEGNSAIAKVADLYSGMVSSLKNLGAPQETAGYAEFSEAAEELATAENEVKLASERGESEGLEAAESKASSALASFQNAASEYGFKACSEGPSAPSSHSTTPGGETGEAESGGAEPEAVEPEAVEPEVEEEAAPAEAAPETGGAEGGGSGAPPASGGSTGGSSGGIGPG